VSLTLHVDGPRWQAHLAGYLGGHRGVVPVVKGNGYGLTRPLLADTVDRLGLPVLAVGTYDEVDSVRQGRYRGDVLVLTPWRPLEATERRRPWLIHTVSRLADLRALSGSGERVVVEVLTSMRRHGIAAHEVPEAISLLDGLRFEGWAMHLPLVGDTYAEARALARLVAGTATHDGDRLWVSHLTGDAAARLQEATRTEVRLRVGTRLWLGDRGALAARSTVLDAHEMERGQTAGYRQRRAHADGTLLVVSGGTAHGVALEAPAPMTGPRQRGAALAKGGLAATGRALSPFRVDGKQRWFFEPPHMQASLLWLPAGAAVPAIGDTVGLDVRFTTTLFDRVQIA
jgi:alanine racemase